MELFARFSDTYPVGDRNIDDDNKINTMLNAKLIKFLKENSIKEKTIPMYFKHSWHIYKNTSI